MSGICVCTWERRVEMREEERRREEGDERLAGNDSQRMQAETKGTRQKSIHVLIPHP